MNRDLVEELIRLGAVVRSAWDASGASQSPYFPPLADAIVDLQKFARTLTRKIKPSRVRHDRAADVVDFGGKFDGVALKAIVTLRLLPTEKAQLAMDAEMAGITPGALVRRRIFGRPVSADINRVMQRRIRSLMAMLQHFLAEQRSRDYPEIYTTGSVLAALFKRLGHDLKNRFPDAWREASANIKRSKHPHRKLRTRRRSAFTTVRVVSSPANGRCSLTR